MVCIAAFIILALVGGVVAIISIFKPRVGKAYLKMFKKAWGCLTKKVRLQKCETGFKDDIKNTLLSRIVIRHPKWLKPLSILIEVFSVVIIVIVVWAILTAVKSLLALWALGTCNVTKPAACTLGAEVCAIEETEPKNPLEATGRWFTEWGEIFEAIPDKFRNYRAEDYNFHYLTFIDETALPENTARPVAVDILDPGCSVCLTSYQNQKAAGFFERYEVRIVPFAIQDAAGNYKFSNSATIVRYLLATEQIRPGLAARLLDRLLTTKNADQIPYQNRFNEDYSAEQAVSKLEQWLSELGATSEEVDEIRRLADDEQIEAKMSENRTLIEQTLRAKGIPTMIYDGKKHTGLWRED